MCDEDDRRAFLALLAAGPVAVVTAVAAHAPLGIRLRTIRMWDELVDAPRLAFHASAFALVMHGLGPSPHVWHYDARLQATVCVVCGAYKCDEDAYFITEEARG